MTNDEPQRDPVELHVGLTCPISIVLRATRGRKTVQKSHVKVLRLDGSAAAVARALHEEVQATLAVLYAALMRADSSAARGLMPSLSGVDGLVDALEAPEPKRGPMSFADARAFNDSRAGRELSQGFSH